MSVVATFSFVGFICGYLSSAPIGPINLWIAHKALSKYTFTQLFWFISGVIAADVTLAGAAVWGYFQFLQSEELHRIIGFVGGPICCIIGLVLVFQNFRQDPGSDEAQLDKIQKLDKRTKTKQFLGGAGLCAANPAFFMFWVVVLDTISSRFDQPPEGKAAFAFLVFIAIGDALWFATLIKLVQSGVNLVRPRAVKLIRYGIGLVFLGFGLFVILQQLM